MTQKTKKKRPGQTNIISISVSKDFSESMAHYKLSPTEIFRRGLAVSLYDLKVHKYQTEVNKKRSEYVKEFLKEIESQEKINKIFKEIASFSRVLEEIKR